MLLLSVDPTIRQWKCKTGIIKAITVYHYWFNITQNKFKDLNSVLMLFCLQFYDLICSFKFFSLFVARNLVCLGLNTCTEVKSNVWGCNMKDGRQVIMTARGSGLAWTSSQRMFVHIWRQIQREPISSKHISFSVRKVLLFEKINNK